MKTGTVVGAVWATKKTAGLTGQTLLTVKTDTGTIIAADCVGAGEGDRVLLTLGSAARAGRTELPIDAAVVGILDMQEENDDSQ